MYLPVQITFSEFTFSQPVTDFPASEHRTQRLWSISHLTQTASVFVLDLRKMQTIFLNASQHYPKFM